LFPAGGCPGHPHSAGDDEVRLEQGRGGGVSTRWRGVISR
jgi:hypothetical protein